MGDILERCGMPRDRTLRDPSIQDNLREDAATVEEEQTYGRGADLWNHIASKVGYRSLPESAVDDIEGVKGAIDFLENLAASLKAGYAEGQPGNGRAGQTGIATLGGIGRIT